MVIGEYCGMGLVVWLHYCGMGLVMWLEVCNVVRSV